MSDFLDLMGEESRQRYLDRACKDGYAVLPDIAALKKSSAAASQPSGATAGEDVPVEESSADAKPESAKGRRANGLADSSAVIGDGVRHDDENDTTKLLGDGTDTDSDVSGSDEDDEAENSDSDSDSDAGVARKDGRLNGLQTGAKSPGDSRPLSRKMRVAYWSCFSVVFSSGIACIVLLVLASPTCNNNTSGSTRSALAWWQTTVIYQVYPRSLQDSDNDGIGDLQGIRSRVDYIYDLGVRTVWLSPIFSSPMVDFGYDISNYTSIAPIFGTMADFDALLEAIHQRGMQLLLDFVPNHTSDQHSWFKESRSNKSSPKRDWYIWRDGDGSGGPPNNWQSLFGGSAWEYDSTTGQFYFHQFTKEQPDLNFRSPDVRAAMMDVLRFWLRRGVDGFRVDAVAFLLEDVMLRNETCMVNGTTTDKCNSWDSMNHTWTFAQPGFHDIVRSFREVLDEFSNATHPRFMVGEMYAPKLEDVIKLYGNATSPECHFPFNFLLIGLTSSQWTGVTLSQNIAQWLDATTTDQWPNWVLGNHDNHRVATRLGEHMSRAANFLLLTLPGTPTTYYGEEIGMLDGNVTWNQTVDPSALNTGNISLSRDPERTPMQWNMSDNAGFSAAGVKTWLPVSDRHLDVNVAKQMTDKQSMLELYKRLVRVRSAQPALQHPNYRLITATTSLLAYVREYNATTSTAAHQYLVVLNVGASAVIQANLTVPTMSAYQSQGVVELSASLTYNSSIPLDLGNFTIASGDAYLIQLTSS